MSALKWRTRLCAAFLLGAAGIAHAAPNMKEGLWEITVKMEMPGMPTSMPPQTTQQCVTRKDLDNPQKMTPGADARNQCSVTNYKMEGNTATWSMACKGPQQMTGSGSVTYNGTSYTGNSKMSMNQGGRTMNMTMNYSGKYVGACRK